MEAREGAVETEAGAAAGVSPLRGAQVRLLEQVEPGLPSRYYTSPDVYEQERARIFATRWLCARRRKRSPSPGAMSSATWPGRASSSSATRPGRSGPSTTSVATGAPSCARRPRDASPATASSARTTPGPTASTGGSRARPTWSGSPTSAARIPLYPAAVTRWEGFIFLSLAERPEPLAAAMGGLHDQFARYGMGRLRRGARRVYEVAADWKLVVENFTECYHCPAIHRSQPGHPVPGGRQGREGRRGRLAGRGLVEPHPRGGHPDGERPAPPAELAGLRAEDAGRVYYNVLYPGLFLSLHPDYVLTHTLWPDGPGRTRVVCEWLFDPDTMARPDFDPGDAVEFWDLVNRQDWKACELTQRGNASRAHAAGVLVGQEAGPRHVARWVLQHLA